MTKEKMAYSVDELAELLGVSRPTAYQLVKREDFPSVRLSQRRIVIPADALHIWLNHCQKKQADFCDTITHQKG